MVLRALNKKRILSFLLALTLIIALTPYTARAATEGKCGDELYWSYSKNILTIYGSGDMYDYQPRTSQNGPNEMPWRGQISAISRIEIKEGCTGIGANAFYNFGTVCEVFFPETLQTIGARAFSNCSSIRWIELPEKLTTMGAEAFSYCSSLSEVSIGNRLTKIADKAFFHDQSLSSLTIAPGCRNVGISAFAECSALKSVDLSNLAVIEAMAFSGTGLSSVTIGRNALYLKTNAFSGCSSLSTVTFDDNANPIEVSSRFLQNTPYYSKISSGLYTIIGGKVLMCKGTYQNASVTVPDGVKLVSDFCFADAKTLSTVSLPETLTGIGENAFLDCDSLTEIYIPKSVNKIGNNALGIYTKDLAEYEEVENFSISSKGFGSAAEYAEKHNFGFSCLHEYEVKTIREDCTKRGLRCSLCKFCGACESMESLDPLKGHSEYIAERIYETCTTDGTIVKKCRNCSWQEKETISKKGHTLTGRWIVVKPATCAERGALGKRCSTCGALVAVEEMTIEKLKEHSPLDSWTTITPATCAEPGREVLFCIKCANVISEREIPATGHTPSGTWEIITMPSDDGEILGCSVMMCSACGDIIKLNWITSNGASYSGADAAAKTVSAMNGALEGRYSAVGIASLDYNSDGIFNIKDTLAVKQLAGK